ncbi:MAG: type III pantothenate kinase [Bacteriovoracaceae bacterium]
MPKTIVTFDNGNSHPHLGIYQDGIRVALLDPMTFLARYPYQEWKDWTFVVSHVGKNSELTEKVFKLAKTITVKKCRKQNRIGDMPIHYQESLGDDRLVQAYSIFQNFKKQNTILIDAGTFITVDNISETGFNGGYIFPGITTYLKSYGIGAHLPVLDAKEIPWDHLELPHSTQEAIFLAAQVYLDGLLEQIKKQFIGSHFVITGGTGTLIKERLVKLGITSITLNPYFIHDALYQLSKISGDKT